MKYFLNVLAVALLLQTAGCGGGGGTQQSAFVGSWSGHWNATFDSTRLHNVTLTVEPNGHATGWITTPGFPMSTALGGTISPSGQVDLTISEINPPPVPSRATGKLYTHTSGGVFGSLLVTNNNTPSFAVAIDLARQ